MSSAETEMETGQSFPLKKNPKKQNLSGKSLMYLCTEQWRWSHDGALGGGQVDGLDADCQGFLQILQDVATGAVRWCVVQELLERLQLN